MHTPPPPRGSGTPGPPSPGEGDAAYGECFVCADGVRMAPRSACACTDRYVHGACQLAMLRHRAPLTLACPVCLADYRNLRVTVEPRAPPACTTAVSLRTATLASVVCTLLGCAMAGFGFVSLVAIVWMPPLERGDRFRSTGMALALFACGACLVVMSREELGPPRGERAGAGSAMPGERGDGARRTPAVARGGAARVCSLV